MTGLHRSSERSRAPRSGHTDVRPQRQTDDWRLQGRRRYSESAARREDRGGSRSSRRPSTCRHRPLAAADIQHIRVRWRDHQRTDRAGRLAVKDRRPGASGIRRLPDTTIADANVEGVRLAGMSGSGLGPPGAQRTDAAPAHVAEQFLVEWSGGSRLRDGPGIGSGNGGERCRRDDERANSGQAVPPRRVYFIAGFAPAVRNSSHER